MQNKMNLTRLSILLLTATTFSLSMNAQVTIGSEEPPKATLEVVAGKSGSGVVNGIIAPRLTLAELNARKDLYTSDQTGAFVYITDVSGVTITGYSDQIICTGFAYWNGVNWVGDCAIPKTFASITTQPQAFSFYEQGTETIDPLVFGAGGSSTMTYQWYKITGSNIHVPIAAPCTASDGTGFNNASFTPTSIIKGTTRNASNCGFYKYYCVAKNQTNDSIVSNVAEVAIGCGAKDMNGEWVSFLCFNLGANLLTIADQKAATITHPDYNTSTGQYTYVSEDNNLYGDLYQWGRIGDGHEKRTNASVLYNAATPPTVESGNLIGAAQHYPDNQVSRSNATYYGKFILGIASNAYNWYPNYNTTTASIADLLWRTGRYTANDPCAKIKDDGITYETYYPPQDGTASANTGWATPSQDSWGNIYRGGSISGSPSIALANTWSWYNGGNSDVTNGVKGFEIKPDGVTTTLFLPASGNRNANNGSFYYAGNLGNYWSSNTSGSNASNLYINSSSVTPGNNSIRTYGFALRCIKY